MLRYEELNAETAGKYRKELAQFYYTNMQTCSCLDHYTPHMAYEKIGDLIMHLSDNTCIAYAALDEEKIVAYIWAYPHQFREERRMYINEITVKEEYQGKGIGKTLIGIIEKKAKEAGFPAVYLHAEANSAGAVRFYGSLGYNAERIQLRKGIKD